LFSLLFSAFHVDLQLEVNSNRLTNCKVQHCHVTQLAVQGSYLMLNMLVLGDGKNELDGGLQLAKIWQALRSLKPA
jgi:hypothetical protein